MLWRTFPWLLIALAGVFVLVVPIGNASAQPVLSVEEEAAGARAAIDRFLDRTDPLMYPHQRRPLEAIRTKLAGLGSGATSRARCEEVVVELYGLHRQMTSTGRLAPPSGGSGYQQQIEDVWDMIEQVERACAEPGSGGGTEAVPTSGAVTTFAAVNL